MLLCAFPIEEGLAAIAKFPPGPIMTLEMETPDTGTRSRAWLRTLRFFFLAKAPGSLQEKACGTIPTLHVPLPCVAILPY